MRRRVREAAWAAAALLPAAAFLAVLAARRADPLYDGRPARAWIFLAVEGNAAERNRAATALEKLDARAVPTLARLVRWRAGLLAALEERIWAGWFGNPLGPEPAAVRALAARLLGRLGPAGAAGAPALVKALADPDQEVLHAARLALKRIGPAALPALGRALRSSCAPIALNALELVGDMEAFGKEALRFEPEATALLNAPEAELRRQAALTLGAWGRATPKTVAALRKALGDPQPAAAQAAAAALGRLRPPPREAVGDLTRLLCAEDPLLRVEACRALWHIEDRAETVLPVLTAALEESAGHWEAALVLGEMGPAAAAAAPALAAAAAREQAHRPDRLPGAASIALSKLGPAAVPYLLALLAHEDRGVRLSAANALEDFGPLAARALPAALRMLSSPSREERITGCRLISAIGPAAVAARPRLQQLVEEETDYLRAAAWDALQSVCGAAAAEASETTVAVQNP